MPPNNACDDITDEDSGDENLLSIENLPSSQLLANAEINDTISHLDSDYDSDPEFNVPLSMFIKKNTKTSYKWNNGDIKRETVVWPVVQTAPATRSPYELFSLFFSEDVINMFVSYSNLYAAQKNHPNAGITSNEIRKFFGILLLSGYNHVSRRRMYWETVEDTHNNLVANAISRDRFEFILSHLHCCDNSDLDKSDKYAKVRQIFEKLNEKFLEYAPHSENHSVDESMIPYFGKHSCKQFIRGKPIRYGYKFWVGTTDKGYIVWFEPYQGAKSVISENYRHFGLGPSVVLTYVDILLSKGCFPYHIFFDNFFTTVPLLYKLTEQGIRGTGTIRENRMSKCPLPEKK